MSFDEIHTGNGTAISFSYAHSIGRHDEQTVTGAVSSECKELN